MAVRFAPNSFQYNGRVAAALVPSLVVVASFGGVPAVALLALGAMVAYVLDAFRQKESAFGAVWISLGLVNLTLVFTGSAFPIGRPIVLGLFIMIINGAVLLLTGVWATLQFKWLQLQYPSVSLAFEKLLLAACLPAAAALQTWGVVSAVGASAAAFYLGALLAMMYYALAIPLASSFCKPEAGHAIGGSRSVSNEVRVQSRLDGVVSALLLVLLPPWFYIAVHWTSIFKWEHFWSVLILASAPWCMLAMLEEGLWWLSAKAARRQAMRLVVLFPALAALLAGVEGRLLLPAFGEYIWLHPPWNYIAVTAALYGVAFLVFLHVAGVLGEAVASQLDGAALMIAAGAGGLAAGIPLMVMPAPLLAAGGLAMYLDSSQLRDYLLFVAGAIGTAVWFVWHHFWFLDASVGGLPVRSVCFLLLLAMLPAALLPGYIRSGASKNVINFLMLIQAGLIFAVEQTLYSGEHEGMISAAYPAFLVMVSSALGMALTSRLSQADRVGIVSAWLLHCIYASKLAMLFVPEAQLALPVLVLVQAITPPLLLAGPMKRKRLEPWRALLHSANVAMAVLLARFAIFDILQFVMGGRPEEGLVMGALLLAVAAGNAPLVLMFFNSTPGPRRTMVLVAAAGTLLMLLRPPLPLKGGARCPKLPLGLCPRLWDDRHIPARDADDAAIYGAGLSRRQHWPLWLLVAAGLSAIAALGSPSRGRTLGTRFLWAAAAGTTAGAYIALEFFPGQPALQVVILLGAAAEGALLTLLQLPAAVSPAWLPLLAAVWGLLFPVALVFQTDLPLPELPPEAVRLFPDSGTRAIDAQRFQTERAAVLAVYAAEALLLAFALKMKVAAAAKSAEGGKAARTSGLGASSASYVGAGYAERAADFLGACLPVPGGSAPLSRLSRLKGTAGPGMVALVSEGLGWVPTACNLATFLAFGLCIHLNLALTDGSDAAIFALAPLLLLLTQDPIMMFGLKDQRRYFPPSVAASLYLALSAASQLLSGFSAGANSLLYEHAREWPYLFRNLVCLLAVLPAHALFARYAWSRARASGTSQLVVLPAALVALLLTDLQTVRVAAGLSVIMTAVQFISMRHMRHLGQKII